MREHWALALDLSCTCMLVPVCRKLLGGDKRAQASTRGLSLVFFSLATMLAFISLGSLGFLSSSLPNLLFSRLLNGLRAAAILAMLALSFMYLASGNACLRAIVLCGLEN